MIAPTFVDVYPSLLFIRFRRAWFKLSPLELGREVLYVSRPGRRVLHLQWGDFEKLPCTRISDETLSDFRADTPQR
jgi:hypothetical protein